MGKRTTPGEQAARQLDGQVESSRRSALPGAPFWLRKRYVELLLDRGTFFGRIGDLEEALEVARATVDDHGRTASTLPLLASAEAALHGFDEAALLLDEAEARGALASSHRAQRASCFQGLGRLDEALALRTELRRLHPTIAHACAEATVLGELGRTAEAEARFAEGIASYRDVSPFPVAYCLFEEGRMWEAEAQPARARELYRAAVRRLPMYAHAGAHLAALEAPDNARARLTVLAATSDDPSIVAQLAEVERRLGVATPPGLAEATARFDELFRAHPLAVADHAARFWAETGQPSRALEAALLAASARPTAAQLALVVEVAEAPPSACEAARALARLPYVPPSLRPDVERAREPCALGPTPPP